MRIPSGKTDQYIYFVAVDATDRVTRETGLSSFTVFRSRKGAAEVQYTTPTVSEIDATNMPGVYALLVDEDTTIDSGSDSEEYCVHISHAGMAPVTRTVELYRGIDMLLDAANTIETGLTVRGALRLALAALAGKLSGAGSGTEVYRNAVGDSKDRITATVTSAGNRTAITTDAT